MRILFLCITTIVTSLMHVLNAQTGVNFAYRAPRIIPLDNPIRSDDYRYPALLYNINTNFITNEIISITEDCYGRIWFATRNTGFGCIDGENLYVYGSHNRFFDRTHVIHSDMTGRIWLGGNGIGVACLSGQYYATIYQKSLASYPDSTVGWHNISDVHIKDIQHDSKNNIWVATSLGGLTCIASDTVMWWNPENSVLKETSIRFLTVDSKDRIWFGCEKEIYYIENFKLNRHPISSVDIVVDGIGNEFQEFVVIVTGDSRYFELTPEGYEEMNIRFPDNLKHTCIRNHPDRNGTFHMSDRHTIYKVIRGNAIEILNVGSETGITDFYFDSNNSLWVITGSQGIIYIPDFSILRLSGWSSRQLNDEYNLMVEGPYLLDVGIDDEHYLEIETLYTAKADEKIQDIRFLSEGVVFQVKPGKYFYFGKDRKIDPAMSSLYSKYDKSVCLSERTFLRDPNGQMVEEVSQAEFTPTGLTFKGTNPFYYDNKYVYFQHDVTDGYHNIVRWDGSACDTVMSHLGGDSTKITGFHYINDSTFVASTWGRYFFLYEGDSAWNITKGCGTNILWETKSDKLGNFFLGGIEAGLNYFDGKSRKVFNLRDGNGLSGSKVINIFITPENDVALSTNLGITILKLKDPSVAVENEEDFNKKYDIFGFTSYDGLTGEQFNGPFIDSLGRYWIKDHHWVLHAIFPDLIKEFSPRHLKIEAIQIESPDADLYTEYRWAPGREYLPPPQLEVDYRQTLVVTLRSVMFKNFQNQTYAFRTDTSRWTEPQSSSTFRIGNLLSGLHTLSFKAISQKGMESDIISINIVVSAPFYESWLFWLGIITAIFICGYLIFRWRTHVVRERANRLEQTVQERTIEIELQKAEIQTSNEEIKGSIAYAKRIQDAILPPQRIIDSMLPDNFILFLPKDIVAGDFYWLERTKDRIIIAAADCTGHGVPGAMVSVVCHNALNRSVREFGLTQPSQILDKTRDLVIETFAKAESEVKDGMDIALCSISFRLGEVDFAGAHNPLWHVRNGALTEYKGDKQPIGSYHAAKPFTQHKLEIRSGDHLYIITDGFGDQFGGEKGKKFKNKILKVLLAELSKKPIREQFTELKKTFDRWKGDLEQIDDICVIGVRV